MPIKERESVRSKIEGLENLYLAHSGRLNSGVDKWWAMGFAGFRHILTSAVIGSATLLAQSDFFFSRMTCLFIGTSFST